LAEDGQVVEPGLLSVGSSNQIVERSVPELSSQTQKSLVRPERFELPTTWFEDAYSKQRKYLENLAFWQFDCATEPPVIPGYAFEIVDTGTFQLHTCADQFRMTCTQGRRCLQFAV
jgi:hypothetical protein